VREVPAVWAAAVWAAATVPKRVEPTGTGRTAS